MIPSLSLSRSRSRSPSRSKAAAAAKEHSDLYRVPSHEHELVSTATSSDLPSGRLDPPSRASSSANDDGNEEESWNVPATTPALQFSILSNDEFVGMDLQDGLVSDAIKGKQVQEAVYALRADFQELQYV